LPQLQHKKQYPAYAGHRRYIWMRCSQLLVVLQANLQLANRFIGSGSLLPCVAEIVPGMLKMFFGVTQ